jgi:hypothetical protein
MKPVKINVSVAVSSALAIALSNGISSDLKHTVEYNFTSNSTAVIWNNYDDFKTSGLILQSRTQEGWTSEKGLRFKELIRKNALGQISTSHCNRAKSNLWPTNKEKDNGIRFLNCCKEVDYGVHIFEDPDTHEVVGVTSEGRYHVDACDLNADHFIDERKRRARIWDVLNERQITLKGGLALPPELALLQEMVKHMIPKIPYLSGEALDRHREIKRALEAYQLRL